MTTRDKLLLTTIKASANILRIIAGAPDIGRESLDQLTKVILDLDKTYDLAISSMAMDDILEANKLKDEASIN